MGRSALGGRKGSGSSEDEGSHTPHPEDPDMPDATFACPNLATFCRLDALVREARVAAGHHRGRRAPLEAVVPRAAMGAGIDRGRVPQNRAGR
jgi:hypothetical protein